MLVSLNPTAAPGAEREEDALDLLLACHERIRSFTGAALRLASAEQASDADVADTAGRLVRYFEIALPLHAADEDLSLRPRLDAVAPQAMREAVLTMTREHAEVDAAVERLLRPWRDIARDPARRRAFASLEPDSAALRSLFDRHLGNEEAHVFPLLRVVPAPELRAIRDEIRARRTPSGAAGSR